MPLCRWGQWRLSWTPFAIDEDQTNTVVLVLLIPLQLRYTHRPLPPTTKITSSLRISGLFSEYRLNVRDYSCTCTGVAACLNDSKWRSCISNMHTGISREKQANKKLSKAQNTPSFCILWVAAAPKCIQKAQKTIMGQPSTCVNRDLITLMCLESVETPKLALD